MPVCKTSDCTNEANAAGLCWRHQGSGRGFLPNISVPRPPTVVMVERELENARESPESTGVPRLPPLVKFKVEREIEPALPAKKKTVTFADPVATVAGTSRPPEPRRLPPLVRSGSSAADQQKFNRDKMNELYVEKLRTTVLEKDYLAGFVKLFHAVCDTAEFSKCLDDQVGWTNASAWLLWFVRVLSPTALNRPMSRELQRILMAGSYSALKAGNKFAERYLLELWEYCEAVIANNDATFVISTASLVFGPLLAPITAIPTIASTGMAGSLVQNTVSKGISALESAVPSQAVAEVNKLRHGAPGAGATAMTAPKKYENLNPMRFTLAWLSYVNQHKEPGDAVSSIQKEFGGSEGCKYLYAVITQSNQ